MPKQGVGIPEVTPLRLTAEALQVRSRHRALKLHIRKAIRNFTDVTQTASRWLWIRRGDPWTT